MTIQNHNDDESKIYNMIDLLVREVIHENHVISIFDFNKYSIDLMPLFNLLIYLGKIVVVPRVNDGVLRFYRIITSENINNQQENLTVISTDDIELHIIPLFDDNSLELYTSYFTNFPFQFGGLKGVRVGLCCESKRSHYDMITAFDYIVTENNRYTITKKP